MPSAMTSSSSGTDLRRWVRDVPDFPKPGILFRDLTPLMRDPEGWQETVRQLSAVAEALQPDLIVGIESRGFIVGTQPVHRPGPGLRAGPQTRQAAGRGARESTTAWSTAPTAWRVHAERL
jgi:Adenine/guanine phosphoribosyltransferases and related PRPP-binding proteins